MVQGDAGTGGEGYQTSACIELSAVVRYWLMTPNARAEIHRFEKLNLSYGNF